MVNQNSKAVAAVEDAPRGIVLPGDALLGVPEPARAMAGFGGVQEAPPIIAGGDAGREGPCHRIGAAGCPNQLLEGVEAHHDAARHRSERPASLRRSVFITTSSIEFRITGQLINTGFC